REKKIAVGEFGILKRNLVPQTARITLLENENSKAVIGIINVVENVGQLKAEIDAVNSIADHNLKKLIKTNEKLENARKAEQEALSVKEKFLTNISHELRTPLSGISGITQLLSNTELNNLQREYVDSILHSTDHLVRMINELLDLSKLKSEKFELEINEFSLNDCLKNVASAFSLICENKNLTFNFSYDKKIPNVLFGDSLRISQIINNLLSNAIKFTNKGYIYLNAQLIKKNKNTAYVNFEIKDTGIGIDKEKLKSIFDEFQQGGSEIARLYGGTGLGLSISKYLVKLQNGEIEVKSKPGEGSTFYFTIPLQIGKKINKTTTTSDEKLKNIKFLIADDNHVNILVIENILKREGAEVTSCKNGKEAVKLFNDHGFDFVLLDLNMPEMNGYQVANNFRKINKDIPIIAVTAGASNTVEKKCMDSGFSTIIYKPFTNEELVAELLKFTSIKNKTNKVFENKKFKNKTPDFDILESISQGDKSIYMELIQNVKENIKNEMPLLKESLENKKINEATRIIHKIKTSYGYIGLTKEVNLLNKAEKLIRDKKDISKANNILDPVFKNSSELIKSLEKKIKK
ncbi:MAG: ATP-binding protein, partial [Bacteroidota bacterium]